MPSFKCKQCGAPLELFETAYHRSPIDEETGEIGAAYGENIPGENSDTAVECSENGSHKCGFTIDKLTEVIKKVEPRKKEK